jgi:hypothetical protein
LFQLGGESNLLEKKNCVPLSPDKAKSRVFYRMLSLSKRSQGLIRGLFGGSDAVIVTTTSFPALLWTIKQNLPDNMYKKWQSP